jgi:hypothetical protein
MKRTQMVLETMVYSPFNRLSRLAARQSFNDGQEILLSSETALGPTQPPTERVLVYFPGR